MKILPYYKFNTTWILFLVAFSIALPAQEWEKTAGPYGGRIRSLHYSNNTLFAGTHGYGVFATADNGSSWNEASNSTLSDETVNCFATIGSVTCGGCETGKFYVSLNFGSSWTQSGELPANAGRIQCLAAVMNKFFAGTSGNGVYTSSDNGTTWEPLFLSLNNNAVNTIAFSGSNMYIGTNNGVYTFFYNGNAWVSVNYGLPNLLVTSIGITGTNIFASTATAGVHLSQNNGDTWLPVNSGINNLNVKCLLFTGTSLFAGSYGGGVYLTTNNGTDWTLVSNGLKNKKILSLSSGNNRIFAGTEGNGVFKSSDNGLSWTETNSGLTALTITCFTDAGNSLFAGTNYGGIFKTKDEGDTWELTNNDITDIQITALYYSQPRLLAGTMNGKIFLSIDSGLNWLDISSATNITPIIGITTNGNEIYVCNETDAVFYTANQGNLWIFRDGDLPAGTFSCFTKSRDTLYCGNVSETETGLYQSTNFGINWTKVNGLPPGSMVLSIAFLGDNIFAGIYKKGLYLSTNRGIAWSLSNTGMGNENIKSLIVKGRDIIAGSVSGKVYYSSDTAKNWINISDKLDLRSVLAMASNTLRVFAGGNKTPVYRLDFPDVVVEPILPGPYCAGDSIEIIYNTVGSFNPSNIFTVQLSDATGSFSKPTDLDSIKGVSGMVIKVKIPENTNGGSGFKIRVTGLEPPAKGKYAGNPIIINPLPDVRIKGRDTACTLAEERYTTRLMSNVIHLWSVQNGIVTGDTLTDTLRVKFLPQAKGYLRIIAIDTVTFCRDTGYKEIELYDTLEIFISGEVTACADSSMVYQTVKGSRYRYSWSALAGNIQGSPNNDSVIIRWQPTVDTSNRIILTVRNDSTGCSATIYLNVIVYTSPKPVLLDTSVTSVLNDTVFYSVRNFYNLYKWYLSGTAGTDYQVIRGGTNADTSILVKWLSPGTKKVTCEVADSNGCRGNIYTNTNVISNLKADAGPDTTICIGSYVKIGKPQPAAGGKPPYTYKWTPVQTLNLDNVPEPIANPQITTLYILTVTDANGTKARDTMKVTVIQLPDVSISLKQYYCEGSQVVIKSKPEPDMIYLWQITGGTIIGKDDLDSVEVLWGNSSPVSVSLTKTVNQYGCSNSNNRQFSLYPVPIPVFVLNPAKVVVSNRYIYSVSVNSMSQFLSYKWEIKNGLQDIDFKIITGGGITDTIISVEWLTAGQRVIKIEATDTMSKCSGIDSSVIRVFPEGIIVNAGPDTSVCTGEVITLASPEPAMGGKPPYIYSWTPAEGLNRTDIPNPLASPDATSEYILTVTDTEENVGRDSVLVSVMPFPDPDINGNAEVSVGLVEIYYTQNTNKYKNTWSVVGGYILGSDSRDTVTIQWGSSGDASVTINQSVSATCFREKTLTVKINDYSTCLEGRDADLPDVYFNATLKPSEEGTVIFTNTCDTPADIEKVTLYNPSGQFFIRNTQPMLPHLISLDLPLRIIIQFRPVRAGRDTAYISLTLKDKTKAFARAAANAIQQDNFSFTGLKLFAVPEKAEPGEKIALEVRVVNTQSIKNLGNLGFKTKFWYNSDILSQPVIDHTIGNLTRPLITPPDYNLGYMDRGYEAEGVTSPNSDVILRVFCNSLLGSVDSSVINFEYFDWNNNSVQAKELHDGIFYLNTCIADGKRLINRKSPLTLNSIGPNPVTGIAVIDYTVIEESYTSINIIDLLGVNKKIIFEGVPTAGNYRVNLEPGLLPSGFYFLVIKTTNEIFYEKIIISE